MKAKTLNPKVKQVLNKAMDLEERVIDALPLFIRLRIKQWFLRSVYRKTEGLDVTPEQLTELIQRLKQSD